MNARASASHPTHKSIHSHSHSISVLYVCVVDVRECITSVYCNSGPHTHTLGRITHVCLYADMHTCTQTQPCTPHIHRTTTNGRGLEINSFVDAYTLISTRYTDFFFVTALIWSYCVCARHSSICGSFIGRRCTYTHH